MSWSSANIVWALCEVSCRSPSFGRPESSVLWQYGVGDGLQTVPRAGNVVAAIPVMIEQPSKVEFPRPVDPIDSPPPDIKPVPPPDIPSNPPGPPDIQPPSVPERGAGGPAI